MEGQTEAENRVQHQYRKEGEQEAQTVPLTDHSVVSLPLDVPLADGDEVVPLPHPGSQGQAPRLNTHLPKSTVSELLKLAYFFSMFSDRKFSKMLAF